MTRRCPQTSLQPGRTNRRSSIPSSVSGEFRFWRGEGSIVEDMIIRVGGGVADTAQTRTRTSPLNSSWNTPLLRHTTGRSAM
jgi:hypothetical protein